MRDLSLRCTQGGAVGFLYAGLHTGKWFLGVGNLDTLASQLALQLRYSRLAHLESTAFLELVARKFGSALPRCIRVSRQWGVLGGRIREMVIDLGGVRYRIECRHPPAYTVERQLVVHGVAVGTAETLDADSWERGAVC